MHFSNLPVLRTLDFPLRTAALPPKFIFDFSLFTHFYEASSTEPPALYTGAIRFSVLLLHSGTLVTS